MHAAALSGIDAIDMPFLAVADLEGLGQEARAAARLGFRGKVAIHPTQVAVIQEASSPGPEEIERAGRIVAAYEAQHGGVLLGDGKLVDRPIILAAQRVLARAGTRRGSESRRESGRVKEKDGASASFGEREPGREATNAGRHEPGNRRPRHRSGEEAGPQCAGNGRSRRADEPKNAGLHTTARGPREAETGCAGGPASRSRSGSTSPWSRERLAVPRKGCASALEARGRDTRC